MKNTLIILLFSACAANAQMWTNVETGAVAPQPERRPADAVNVSADWFILPGWQPFTLAQQADWDAARDAEDAEAEAQAAAQATLPLQSATGFAAQDENGHWIEFVPMGDGLPIVGDQVSNSPLTPEERAVMKAEREAMRAVLIAKSKDKTLNDKQKIALLMEAFFGVNE